MKMNILHLAFQTGISKKLPRTGWLMHKVKNPESVAEHAFRVIVMAMSLAPFLDVDQNKLIKMAIIHDLGETSTGDLVVEKGRSIDKEAKKQKEKIEEKAVKEILWEYGEEYAKLFHEMIQRKTKEALVFWELDKLEMAIQAYEYQKAQKINLEEFIENADSHIRTPLLKDALNELKNKIKQSK